MHASSYTDLSPPTASYTAPNKLRRQIDIYNLLYGAKQNEAGSKINNINLAVLTEYDILIH